MADASIYFYLWTESKISTVRVVYGRWWKYPMLTTWFFFVYFVFLKNIIDSLLKRCKSLHIVYWYEQWWRLREEIYYFTIESYLFYSVSEDIITSTIINYIGNPTYYLINYPYIITNTYHLNTSCLSDKSKKCYTF